MTSRLSFANTLFFKVMNIICLSMEHIQAGRVIVYFIMMGKAPNASCSEGKLNKINIWGSMNGSLSTLLVGSN